MRNETPEARMKRLSYLKPVKKGEIKNPAGRGVGKDIWKWAAQLGTPEKFITPMRKMFRLPKSKITMESAILLRLVLEACKGDMKAIELWLDRRYGKVTQQMNIATENGPLVAILNAPQGDQTIRVTTKPMEQKKIIDINPTEDPSSQANTPPD